MDTKIISGSFVKVEIDLRKEDHPDITGPRTFKAFIFDDEDVTRALVEEHIVEDHGGLESGPCLSDRWEFFCTLHLPVGIVLKENEEIQRVLMKELAEAIHVDAMVPRAEEPHEGPFKGPIRYSY